MQLTALLKDRQSGGRLLEFNDRVFKTKLLLKMKLTIIFLTITCLQVSATGYTQNVTLNQQNASLEKIFKEIRKQTGFNFLFSEAELESAKKVSIRVKNMPVRDALLLCLRDQPLIYTVENNNIIVKRSPPVERNTDPVSELFIPPIPVKGKVVNDRGEAMVGVTVTIKGTNKGTSTNESGEFSIDIPDGSPKVLVFSFVGMEPQEINVSKNTSLNVVMKSADVRQQEVVVVGYGSQSRRNVSSSIASVNADQIKDMAVTGIDKAIQGKASGVMVTNNTGEPGGGVTIRIRGTTSIGSGNDPLYIVDGIPLENTQTSNINVGEGRVNGMSQINPSDIQSIQILKDAAATSIYGARAANGVVLITTKRGIKGKGEINIDYYSGLSEVSNKYDLLGASDYAILANEGRKQLAASQPQYSPVFTDEFIRNPTTDVDWQDEIFRTSAMHNINASLRGGNDNTRYMVSGGYFDQGGVLVGTGFKRYSLRANVDQKVSEKLSVGVNLYSAFTEQTRTKNDGSPVKGDASNNNHIYGSPVLSTALVKSPAAPIYMPDGTFALDSLQMDYANPLRQSLDVDINTNVSRILASAFLEYKIIPQLSFRSQLSGDLRSENEKWFNPPNPNQFVGTSDGEGQASRRTFDQKFWTFDNYLTYTNTFNEDHNFSFLVGNSMQKTRWENSFILVSGIATKNIPTLNAGTEVDIATSNIESYGIVSYFSRLNYDYQGKYLLLVNARYDGSSRFGRANRFGFFPSGSVGWRVSQEPFMQSVKFIDDLKARVSYGITGNQEISNFAARGIMALGGGVNTGSNYTGVTGATISSLPTEDLKWEETSQLNFGIDLSVLGSRLNFTIDYYIKRTDNLLFNVPLPATRGFGSKLDNIGKMENKGIEFSVNAGIISTPKFTWTADFNISSNKNKVLSLRNNDDVLVGNQFAGYSIARVGEPISFYLFQREKHVDPATGALIIVDQDKSGGVPNEKDLVISGSPFPEFFGGVTNNFTLGNFDLSMFFQYSYGNEIYNLTRAWIERLDLSDKNIIGTNTTVDAFRNRWQKPGDVTEYPKVNYDDSNPLMNYAHNGWLEDGSYLRLKTLSIGYSFPARVLSKLRVKNMKVYVSANNLLTFSNYKGLDPEVDHFTGVNVNSPNSGLRLGYDYGSYPQSKIYMAGINVTF